MYTKILGDLTTLSILAFFGSIFLKAHVRESWLNNFVIILFLFLIPFWVTFAKHDECSYQVLREGWSPIIFSMVSGFFYILMVINLNIFSLLAVAGGLFSKRLCDPISKWLFFNRLLMVISF